MLYSHTMDILHKMWVLKLRLIHISGGFFSYKIHWCHFKDDPKQIKDPESRNFKSPTEGREFGICKSRGIRIPMGSRREYVYCRFVLSRLCGFQTEYFPPVHPSKRRQERQKTCLQPNANSLIRLVSLCLSLRVTYERDGLIHYFFRVPWHCGR
jgi:hypothetical protein